MIVELHVDIARPPDVVFHWLSDPHLAMQWMTSVTSVEILHESPEHIGTRFRERVSEGGKHVEITGEITGWVADESISFHLVSSYNETNVEYRLEPVGGATRLSVYANSRFLGVHRVVMFLLGPILKRKIVAQLEAELSTLRDFCEGRTDLDGS